MVSETKAVGFKRVAERRTQEVLTDLRLLGQCANRRTYEFSPDQVHKIFREIRRNLKETENKFTEQGNKNRFRLG